MSLPNIKISKKIIILVIALVIIAEALWAFWTIRNNQSAPVVITNSATSAIDTPKAPLSTLSLTSDKTNFKVGDRIDISVNISSSRFSDGVDLLINYDPKVLEIVSSKNPVKVAKVFNDYPANIVDERLGKVALSGISTARGGTRPQGLLGTVSFNAKLAGNTKVSLDFTPGSTKDSNVIDSQTKKDILERVEDLEVSIKP